MNDSPWSSGLLSAFMMSQKLLVLVCVAIILPAGQMTDDMVQYISDYVEMNKTLLNKDCAIFLTSDNCKICQGIDLQWLARYLDNVGRSLTVFRVNVKANVNLTHFFASEPPAFLAAKDGFLKEYGDDVYLINVVEWLESIFPAVHKGPTKVWFSDEIISELQENDVAGKKFTMAVVFFTHTTIAKAKLFVHYRQTAEIFKGMLRFHFVDLGSAGGKKMSEFMAGRTRIAPQVLYINSEGRATGPLDRLPVNTYIITKWVEQNYQYDIFINSYWRNGSGLITKLTNMAQLKVVGHTVILFVWGRSQVSIQAYNFLLEAAKYMRSEVIHFWMLDLSIRRYTLTRQLDVSQYSVGLPFYMSIDSDGDKKVLPHSSSEILIQWLINITITYAEYNNTSEPSAEEYQPGVVNSYNEKSSREQLRRGIGFGLFLYTDVCSWCKTVRKIWKYLAKQCQQVIFVEAKPSDITHGTLSDLLIQGNGIFYVNKEQTDIVVYRFDFDKTVTMIKTFVTHMGDWKYMDAFIARNKNTTVDEDHWPQDLHCYNASQDEATTLSIHSDTRTTISPLLNLWTPRKTLNENKTSLGNQHLTYWTWLAPVSITMATMCQYA